MRTRQTRQHFLETPPVLMIQVAWPPATRTLSRKRAPPPLASTRRPTPLFFASSNRTGGFSRSCPACRDPRAGSLRLPYFFCHPSVMLVRPSSVSRAMQINKTQTRFCSGTHRLARRPIPLETPCSAGRPGPRNSSKKNSGQRKKKKESDFSPGLICSAPCHAPIFRT